MIAVLGRGESLRRFNESEWKNCYDKIYLVNKCDLEVSMIGLTPKQGEIIHVTGRKGATVMEPITYNRLEIKRIVSNSKTVDRICNIKRYQGRVPETRPECMMKRGYRPIGWDNILEGKNAPKKSDNGRAWPTTGMFAIDLALTENSPDEIHLYGFDLYNKKYLVKKNRPYQNQKNPKIKMMYVHLKKLADEFSDTKFKCFSEVEIDAENWICD